MVTRGQRWFRRWRRTPAPAVRLFCFPHAGGSASFYHAWAACVPGAVDLRGVQYPGREDRIDEALVDDMQRLADEIAYAMRPLLDVPVVLFGHSMGAAVAYEVARRLPPDANLRRLCVSAYPAPQSRRASCMHRCGDDDLVAELCRLGSASHALLHDHELRDLSLPVVRNDYRLIETYRPPSGPRLACDLTAVLGDSDSEVTSDEVLGWRERVCGRFELRLLPGDHFYLVQHQRYLVEHVLGLPTSAYEQPLCLSMP